MTIVVFIFFIGLIGSPSLIAEEGTVVWHSTFYDEADEHHEHEHGGDEHHELDEDRVEVEEEHHHHHAHTQTAIVTTAPVITSAPLQVGGAPLTLSQEVGLVKTPVVDDKPKKTDSNSYRPIRANLSNDFVSLDDDDVQVDQDPVTRFFRTDIWADMTFRRSLLEEYNNFFDSEINRLAQVKKGLKKRKSEARESVISTPFFTEALEKFKESNEGIQLQSQLESYVTIITRFIKAQKSQSRKIESSQSKKSPTLEVTKLEKIAIVGDEVTSYVLTYKGDAEVPIYVTERSMRLLFGQSFFSTFLTQQNLKKVTIFIPYKSLLDVFNNKDRLFSLSLLRNKIYYTDFSEDQK